MPSLEPEREKSSIDEKAMRELQEKLQHYAQRLTADVEPALVYIPARFQEVGNE